jgi:hypothetical protein
VNETELLCATGLGLLFAAILAVCYADRLVWLWQTARKARR